MATTNGATEREREDGTLPWDRQPRESAVAYNAFVIFRDLGARRAHQPVADRLTVSRALVKKWSARWSWVGRAGAFDHAERARLDAQRVQSQAQMVEQHRQAASVLLGVALRALRAPEGADVDRWSPSAAKISAATSALDRAVHHQRLAAGLPTDVTRTDFALRATMVEVLEVQHGVRAIIEEQLCEECRAAVGAALRRVADAHRRLDLPGLP